MTNDSTIVLFADISGSVTLYERLGDLAAKQIVVELQDQLSHTVTRHAGVVHEIIGDELLCRFESAESAISCATAIHRTSSDYCEQWQQNTQNGARAGTQLQQPLALQMRVGIHCGPAILEGSRLFGDTINTAARIMSIAQAGQTIISEQLLLKLPADTQKQAREFDTTRLRGKSENMVVYDFPWQVQDLTLIQQVAVSSTPTTLQLLYASKAVEIEAKDCPFMLGRAVNSQIVIDSEPVSRRHVFIEFARGRFVVSDKSTNGTHVYPENSETIYLRREQLPLWGSGHLSLGAPEGEAINHIVKYVCRSTTHAEIPSEVKTVHAKPEPDIANRQS